MPTPIDILFDPITLGLMALFSALLVWERLAPARPMPALRGWWPRVIGAMLGYLMLSSYLPLLWAETLAPLQLFDLSGWPTLAAAAAGVLAYELLGYGYHRATHRYTPLWRLLHQMHHSAERLDVSSAFWFSPFDMIGWTLVNSIAFTVMGLPPAAATPAILFISFLALFQHANVHTPQWLGYLVQRPESHSLHHSTGVHRHNYSDLPVFDMIFGSFRNPARHARETGFWHGASARVLDMLLLRDVSTRRR